MKHFLILFTFLITSLFGHSQLVVDIYPTEEFMIKNMLIGDTTMDVWNVQFGGAHDARGIFYSKNTPIPIAEGILLSTGHAVGAQGPNNSGAFTKANDMKGDKDLHYIANYKTYDAAWISFEFTATQDLIRFNYVFGSEEYPEYVGSPFNDVFGFFLTDLETGEMWNLAVLPNTEIPITVNNINHKFNTDFYLENRLGVNNADTLIQFDGLTQPLIAYSDVVPGRKYRIKIAIADVADNAFDSGVFLEGKSFTSENRDLFYDNNRDYINAFEKPNYRTQKSKPKTPTTVNKTPPTNDETPTPQKETIKSIDSIIVYFDFDESTPTSTSLNTTQKELSNYDLNNYHIQVIGHTDQKGSEMYNQHLSKKRTMSISNWIKTKYNYTDEIKTQWKSFNELAVDQIDENSRSKNRRVIIYLIHK